MKNLTRPAIVLFLALSCLTGLIYPFSMIGLGAQFYPKLTNGSILQHQQKPIGSTLIGQIFTKPDYFWGRPSATAPVPYNASASGGSNLAPSNPIWLQTVQKRIASLQASDPNNQAPIPIDLITASASGLDPHISLAAAHYQIVRVARHRHLNPISIQTLVDTHAELPWLGFLGEPKINVLTLNLALDQYAPH